MLRKLYKRKKGQNLAEYAILIALVIAAVVAMQVYVKRSLQARIFDATNQMIDSSAGLGDTAQYEPYYLTTNFQVTRNLSSTETQGVNVLTMGEDSTIRRAVDGFQEFSYNATGTISNGMQRQ